MSSGNRGKGLLAYIVVAVILLGVFAWYMSLISGTGDTLTYSEVIAYFDELSVREYTLDLGTGELHAIVEAEDGEKEISYTVPNVSLFLQDTQSDTNNYRQAYNEAHPDAPLKQDYFKIKDNSWILTVIPTVILIVLTIAIFVYFIRQSGGNGKYTQFAKANVKNQSQNGKKTTFDDVAGADEEKEELREIVDFLKNPKKYSEIGARIPKGVLLMGPPGTGKTLLAKAVAGEAGCPFFSISGSDFVEMFVGVGASRVRDLFEQAKKNAPAIIFIDEIDAVGRHRGAGLGGGHDEREQTLNQLLVEMDGFTGNENIIVIAATNRSDILDPALLRPGRFDRQVVVNYPDVKGREEILKVHTRQKPLGPDVDLKTIAQTTSGFTGADLENLMNEAALLAARANRKAITEADIEEATMKVVAGPEKKSHIVTERDKRITAFHEAGHAVSAFHLDLEDKVQQISIIQRGMAAGLTWTRPDTDDRHVSREKMKQSLVMLLGGRVAESIMLNDICTGASNDLERATSIARAMVTKYGFSDKLGNVVYGSDQGEVFLGRDFASTDHCSEKITAQIDEEIRVLIDEAYARCKQILTDHKDQLEFIGTYLIYHEKIDSDDFEKLMNGPLDLDSIKPSAEENKTEQAPIDDSKPDNGAENSDVENNVSDDSQTQSDDESNDTPVND